MGKVQRNQPTCHRLGGRLNTFAGHFLLRADVERGVGVLSVWRDGVAMFALDVL